MRFIKRRKEMKKKIFFAVIVTIIVSCGKISINCFASIPRYNMNQYKKVTVKKSSKVKFVQPAKSKITWKVSNKRIATINKKGMLRTKKCGKVKVIAKTTKKKYICNVTIKKKIVRATAKTVYGNTIKINDGSIDFIIYNKSDECISLVLPQLEYNDKGIWEADSKKSNIVNIGVWPNIVILPRSNYRGSFDYSAYNMTHRNYRIVFNKVFIGPNYKKELRTSVSSVFEFI